MNFRLVDSDPDLISSRILPSTEPIENLKSGESYWDYSSEVPTLNFYLKKDSTESEVVKNFRLLAHRNKHRWGEVPVVDFSGFDCDPAAAIKGLALSNYEIGIFKTEKSEKQKTRSLYILSNCVEADSLNRAEIEAEVQMRIMELVDLPPNKLTPEDLGHWARHSAKCYGYECEVWNDDHVIAAHLHAVHAVGRGSPHDPVFIVSKYFGRESKEIDLALVGKGVTFDTGGISIKGAQNMHFMKCDMAGAAAVLGAIEWAARLEIPLNIAVAVPAVENGVDGNSLIPGEVIQTHSGKTVEVIDTDAEGRLILADALSWTVKNLKPDTLIDFATLTGSSVRALGYEAAALYSSNEELGQSLMDAGISSGDKCWAMPLWDDYNHYVDSDIADLANLPAKPVAGSIAAAKFLQAFTNNHPKWAHIDMPGMSFQSSPFVKNKSATGFGIALLRTFVNRIVKGSL